MTGFNRLRIVGLLATMACGRIGFAPDGTDARPGDGATVDTLPMLSCVGLPSVCGPVGMSPCCGSTSVPAGSFFRSYDVALDGRHPDMGYPATVSEFQLDVYEVTVGRFRRFVEAGMGTQANPPPAGSGARMLNGQAMQAGWDPAHTPSLTANTAALVTALKCVVDGYSWTDAAGANEALPINCVTWFEAFAFCAWDGGFLPTEAEWNYAAAGGNEQRAYPWSSPPELLTLDCNRANYNGGGCVGAVDRVGSESQMGDGKWGHADLSGNVWEWVLDWYAPYTTPCDDCANLMVGTARMIRGGSFANVDTALRTAYRSNTVPPAGRGRELGFRCARALQ